MLMWKLKLLRKVIARDEELCVRCGKLAVDVHHIIPKSKAAKNSRTVWREENMICLCRACHTHGQKKAMRRSLLALMRDRYGYDMAWAGDFGWVV